LEEYEKVLEQLREMIGPRKIILYGTKRDLATGAVNDIDVCLVVNTEDKTALEHELYLAVDSEISFDLIIYTPEEWETLTADHQSFAHRILQKGTVVYER
jgi:predicted nucleotidyltransferase